MSDELIKRKLFRASPAGRLKVHLQNIAGLEKNTGGMPKEFDFSHYRRFVEVAADKIEQGLLLAALQFLAKADHALALLEHEWDPDRIRGVKVGQAARDAAAKTNALHGDLRQARLSRMGELVDGMGVDSAAAQCETEGLGRWDTIKRQWNRHKEKRDT